MGVAVGVIGAADPDPDPDPDPTPVCAKINSTHINAAATATRRIGRQSMKLELRRIRTSPREREGPCQHALQAREFMRPPAGAPAAPRRALAGGDPTLLFFLFCTFCRCLIVDFSQHRQEVLDH